MLKRVLTLVSCLIAVASAYAGTITVTSPDRGSATAPTLVKGSTSINFNLRQMGGSEARISITVRRLSDNTIFLQNNDATRVSPNITTDDGSGTYTLTFSEGTPEVAYKVEIRATPTQSGATLYNTDQDVFVKPDLTSPKILEFNPVNASFVRGATTIRVRIKETNLKDWRVQVNNQDIPNNQGTVVNANGFFTVPWDPTGIRFDGPQSISIRVRDQADNETTQNLTVTLDRVKPTISIQTPRNNTAFGAGTTVAMSVDIKDLSTSSIDVTGVDVVIRDAAGNFISRVSRMGWQAVAADTNRWTGRIRWRAGLPTTMRITVTAVDRAGNVATAQTITIRFTP